MSRKLVGTVLAVAAVAALGACGSTSVAEAGSTNTKHPPTADVTITKCGISVIDAQYDNNGYPQASVTITNHSSKASDYDIQVGFFKGATRADVGYSLQSNIAAGQTATDTAGGTTMEPGSTPITCKVVSVSRTAALGS